MSKLHHRILLASLGVVAVLAVVSAMAALVEASYRGRVLPRTSVAGVSLSGQDQQAAQQILVAQATKLETMPMVLQLEAVKQSVTPTDLGISLDLTAAQQTIFTAADALSWLKPGYWQNFFRAKPLALTYSQTDDQLRQTLEQKLGISAQAKDAGVVVTDGALTVATSQPGVTIDVAKFKVDLASYFRTGVVPTIALQSTSKTPPNITDATAQAVKAQIDQSLRPVSLSANNKTYVIAVTDQYGLISYTTTGSELTWQIASDKLKSYLQTQIASKLNVKPVQQVIENNTERVITTGVNGQAVDVAALQPNVLTALTSSDPKPAAIAVPFKPVAFSETHVNPSYSLNTFPSLYLDVSLSQQKITIINTDTVIAQYSISSGGWKTPTPIGTFYIFNKIKEAYSPDFKLWMPNWNGLATSPDGTGYLGYGLHAIVCWDKACTNREGASHIGHPVSHGCIRVDDAGIGYIYDQVPVGTPVVIHT